MQQKNAATERQKKDSKSSQEGRDRPKAKLECREKISRIV